MLKAAVILVACALTADSCFAHANPSVGVAAAPDLASLSKALRSAPGLRELNDAERALLADRVAEYCEVRSRPTADDYIALMQSWGATYRIDEHSREVTQAPEQEWDPAGSDCAIAQIDASRLNATIIAGFLPDGRTITSWPRIEGVGVGQICLGVFTFAGNTDDLARAGQPVAQFTLPAVMGDGSTAVIGMRWVWNPDAAHWVPWQWFEGVPEREGVCIRFF